MSQRSKTAESLTETERVMLQNLMIKAGLTGDGLSTDSFTLVDEGGSMNDSSKRRGVSSETLQQGYSSGAVPVPLPGRAGEHQFGMTPAGTAICLPDGVQDMESWGRTLISFGRYQSYNMCYVEACASESAEMVKYLQWCASRVDSSQGELRDFALYIWAHRFLTEGPSSLSQKPVIPGSNTVRRFKK